MIKEGDIQIFDALGNLTPEAIHLFKKGKLSGAELKQIQQFLADSPLDAEAVKAYNPDQKERFEKLNDRLNQRIDTKAGTIESTAPLNWGKIFSVVGGVVVVFATTVFLIVFQSEEESNSGDTPPVVEEQITDEEKIAKEDTQTEVQFTQSEEGISSEQTKEAAVVASAFTPNNSPITKATDEVKQVGTSSASEKETEEKEKVLNIKFAISSEYVEMSSLDEDDNQSKSANLPSNKSDSEQILMLYLKKNVEVMPSMLSGGNGVYGATLKSDGSISNVVAFKGHSDQTDAYIQKLLKKAPLASFASENGEFRYTVRIVF